MTSARSVTCDYCGRPAVLCDSAEVYRGPSYGMIWICRPCNAYVGCHKNSPDHAPLGRLADADLRAAKVKAHVAFDPLWRNGPWHLAPFPSRSAAYRWLAQEFGIAETECHIGMFDIEQCEIVTGMCNLRMKAAQ